MSSLDQLAGVAPPPSTKRPIADVQAIVYPPEGGDADADKFLPWVWQRLQQDNLVSIYFPGGEQTGFPDFVKMFTGGSRILLLVEKNQEGQLDRMIGFASWTPLPFGGGRSAVAGFIFFKDFWDGESSSKAAMGAMRYWFDSLQIETLMGLVAEANIVAQRFLKRMGWVKLGAVPHIGLYQGQACDGGFWFLTREQFSMRANSNGHA